VPWRSSHALSFTTHQAPTMARTQTRGVAIAVLGALVALAGRPYEDEFLRLAESSGKAVEKLGKIAWLREEG